MPPPAPWPRPPGRSPPPPSPPGSKGPPGTFPPPGPGPRPGEGRGAFPPRGGPGGSRSQGWRSWPGRRPPLPCGRPPGRRAPGVQTQVGVHGEGAPREGLQVRPGVGLGGGTDVPPLPVKDHGQAHDPGSAGELQQKLHPPRPQGLKEGELELHRRKAGGQGLQKLQGVAAEVGQGPGPCSPGLGSTPRTKGGRDRACRKSTPPL